MSHFKFIVYRARYQVYDERRKGWEICEPYRPIPPQTIDKVRSFQIPAECQRQSRKSGRKRTSRKIKSWISYLSCVRSYSLRPRLRPRARFFSLHRNTTRLITYVRNTEKRRRPIHTNFTRKRAEIDCRNIFCFCQTRCMTNGTWAWFDCLAYSRVS